MKNALRAVVGLILVLVVIVVGVVSLSLGRVVKTAVEAAGPRVLGAPVTLGLVTVSPWSGRATLREVVIGNPSGYKSAHAVRVGLVDAKVKLASLLSDTIVVESVDIREPELVWEVGNGGSNITQLQRNAEEAAAKLGGGAKAPAEPAPAPAKAGKSLLIQRLDVTGGKVGLSATAFGGQGLSAPLPEVHLKDLGGKGRSPAQAVAEVMRAVTSSAQRAVTNIGGQALDAARGAAATALGGLFKGLK
jgi:uncharacterized protein involved in outer membrane biogenesis